MVAKLHSLTCYRLAELHCTHIYRIGQPTCWEKLKTRPHTSFSQMLNLHSLQTATWANFISTKSCVYLNRQEFFFEWWIFPWMMDFEHISPLPGWFFLSPPCVWIFFLYKAMENCSMEIAGLILIFLYASRLDLGSKHLESQVLFPAMQLNCALT